MSQPQPPASGGAAGGQLPTKKGLLKKQGGLGGLQWQERFFVLQDNKVAWYKPGQAYVGAELGVIDLNGLTVDDVKAMDSERPTAFTIASHDKGNKHYVLLAPNETECSVWVTTIRRSIRKMQTIATAGAGAASGAAAAAASGGAADAASSSQAPAASAVAASAAAAAPAQQQQQKQPAPPASVAAGAGADVEQFAVGLVEVPVPIGASEPVEPKDGYIELRNPALPDLWEQRRARLTDEHFLCFLPNSASKALSAAITQIPLQNAAVYRNPDNAEFAFQINKRWFFMRAAARSDRDSWVAAIVKAITSRRAAVSAQVATAEAAAAASAGAASAATAGTSDSSAGASASISRQPSQAAVAVAPIRAVKPLAEALQEQAPAKGAKAQVSFVVPQAARPGAAAAAAAAGPSGKARSGTISGDNVPSSANEQKAAMLRRLRQQLFFQAASSQTFVFKEGMLLLVDQMNDESEVSVRVTDQHLFLRHTARARDGVDAHEVKHQFRLDELSLPPEFPLDFVQTLVVAYLPGRLALRAPTVDVRGVWWSLLTALTCIRQRVSTEMPHCEARLAMLSLVRLDYEPRYCVVDNNRLLVYASLFAYRNVPTKPEDSIDLAVATLVTDGELLPKGDLVFALIIRSNVAQEKRYFFDPASADQRRMWIEVIRLSQKRFAMRKTGGSKSSLAIAMNAVGTIERAFYKRRPNVRSMREERERERATVQDILVRWRYYKDRIQTAKLQRWVLLASALQQEADSHVDDGETQAQGVHDVDQFIILPPYDVDSDDGRRNEELIEYVLYRLKSTGLETELFDLRELGRVVVIKAPMSLLLREAERLGMRMRIAGSNLVVEESEAEGGSDAAGAPGMRRDDRQASRARRADADYFENEEDVVSGAGGAGDDAAGAGADEEEEEEDEGYRSDSSEEELGPRLLASPSGAAGRDGAAAPSTTSPGSRSGGASDGVVAIRPGGDAGRQDGGDGTVQPYSSKQLSSSAMKTIFGMMSYEELSKSSAKVIEDEPGVLRSLFTLVWQKSGRDLKDGFKYKRFRVPEASQFEGYGDQERFFTSSERQRLVFSVLRSVRVENNESLFQAAADNGDDSDEEQEAQLFEPKDEIVGKLLHKGVIKAVFPGHEAEPTFVMADLGLRFHIDNSIERIRKYFGESLALYFSWLAFYTKWLVLPTFFGILLWVYQEYTTVDNLAVPFFNLIMAMWAAFFLTMWKRRSAELSHVWNTRDAEEDEVALPEYHGTLRRSPVTGEPERHFPARKRWLRYLVTIPVTFLMVGVVVVLMVLLLQYKDSVDPFDFIMSKVPSVINAVVVIVLDKLYNVIAVKLNDFENHPTQTRYQNALIVKLFFFQFINSFLSLYWIAFVRKDLLVLREQLATLMVIRFLVGNLTEVVVPFVRMRLMRVRMERKLASLQLDVEPVVFKALREAEQPSYDSTLDDYAEMVVQFGYVTLFAAAFPLVAALALVNNFVEMRSDLLKLLWVHRRPQPTITANIGSWYYVLYVLSVIAIITNTAMLAVTSAQLSILFPTADAVFRVLAIALLEHVFLLLKFLVGSLTPDVPDWVSKEIEAESTDLARAANKQKQQELQSGREAEDMSARRIQEARRALKEAAGSGAGGQ